MRIRLEGTPDECRAAAELIGRVLKVLEVSEPYANRSGVKVRVYLDVRLPT